MSYLRKNMYDVEIVTYEKTSDGCGGKDTTEIGAVTIKSMIDLLGESDKFKANQFTVESTHIMLTYDRSLVDDYINKKIRFQNKIYKIDFVDAPLNFSVNRHIEVYLKL